MNLRILLHSIIIFSALMLGNGALWAQCSGLEIQIQRPSGNLENISDAGVNPCGVTPCAEVCPNDLTNYTLSVPSASGGATYNWAVGSGVNIISGVTTDPTIIISLTNSSAIQVNIVDGACDTTIVVELITTRQVSGGFITIDSILTTNESACEGSVLELDVDISSCVNCTGVSYEWFDALDSSLATVVQYNYTAGTLSQPLKLRRVGVNECIIEDNINIESLIVPSIDSLSIDKSLICEGDNLTAMLNAGNLPSLLTAGANPFIVWEVINTSNNQLVESVTNNSNIWEPASIASIEGGHYIKTELVADYGNGNFCSIFDSTLNSNSFLDSFIVAPKIVASLSAVSEVCENENTTLSVNNPNGEQYTYSWAVEGSPVVNTQGFYTDSGWGGADTYQYNVSITDIYTCQKRDSVQLVVKPIPEIEFVGGLPLSVCDGGDLISEVKPTLGNQVTLSSYTWSSLGGSFVDSSCQVLDCATFLTTQWSSGNSLEVFGTGVNGCTSSPIIGNVNIVSPPTGTITANPDATTSPNAICSGTSISLTGNPASGNVSDWFINGISQSSDTTLLTTTALTNTTDAINTYEIGLELTAGNNCKDTVYETIYIRPEIIANLPYLGTQCDAPNELDVEVEILNGLSTDPVDYTFIWTLPVDAASSTVTGSTEIGTIAFGGTSSSTNDEVQVVIRSTAAPFCSTIVSSTYSVDTSCDMSTTVAVSKPNACPGDEVTLTVENYIPPNSPYENTAQCSSCQEVGTSKTKFTTCTGIGPSNGSYSTSGSCSSSLDFICDNSDPGKEVGLRVIYTWEINGVVSQTYNANTYTYTVPQATAQTTLDVKVTYGYQKKYITSDGDPTNSTCITGWGVPVYDGLATNDIVVNRPQVQTRPSIRTCQGQNIALSAICPSCGEQATYIWDNAIPENIGTSTSSNASNDYSTTVTYFVTADENFSVTATDGYGCTTTGTTSVTIQASPGLELHYLSGAGAISSDEAFYCPTSSVGLDAITSNPCLNCSYSWSTGQTSPSITVNQSNIYTVTVSENDCIEIDQIDVKPYPLNNPILNEIGTIPLCGTTQTISVLSASCPGCSYLWNTGATTSSITTNIGGGFYVEAIDTNGCIGYSDPVLTVESNDGNNSIATADPSAICNGSPVALEVTPCLNCSYTWVDGSGPIDINSRFITVNTSGNYYAQVTNADGCAYNSNIVNISSVTITNPSISTNTNILCTGSSATLEVSTLPGFAGYQWYNNGNVISGATDSVYSTTFIGNYYCEVTFANGCVEESNVITISNGTFNPEASSTNSVVCQGEIVEISTASYAGWSYQWYKDGILMSGETGATLDATLAGNYYCEVINDDLCTSLTNIINLGTSTINSISALTLTPTICPGDTAILSVSLCANCSYQWYDAISGNPLNGISSPSNFNFQAGNSGEFYARVNNGFCFTNSDTVEISLLPTPPATINSLDTIVCDGVLPTLFTTQACSGCNYTWLKDGSPIFGALNDSVYQVPSATDIGAYQILITYSNGCSDTSVIRNVVDGTFNTIIEIDVSAGDSLACNGSDVILDLDNLNSDPIDCSAPGCTYRWIRNGVPIPFAVNSTHTTQQGGIYKLEVTDRRGCREESNNIQVLEVNFSPTLTANPGILCDTQRVDLEVSSCLGCIYDWYGGGNSIPATYPSIIFNTDSTIINTDIATIYFVDVTKDGCTARTPLLPINQATTPGVTIAATDLNVCAGDTVTLFRQGGGCGSCTFQWLLNDVPVTAATTPLLVTDSAGTYTLEMSIIGSNCKDTSSAILLADIPPPTGFDLDMVGAGLTPLPATVGTQVNLFNAVQPAYLQVPPFSTSGDGFFYSQPFDAALPPNSGLSNPPTNNIFHADSSGTGFHRIYYQYDTAGCSFITSDIMYVLNEPNVTVANENLNAPLYEACVSDTLVLNVETMPFKIDSVYLLDVNNNYQLVPIATDSLYSTTYGGSPGTTVWDGFIRIGIPAWAQESFMLVTSANNVDTFITPFILIHNENLNIGGLPTTVCSNGDSIALTGTPLGGYFTAEYMGAAGGSNMAAGANVPGAFSSINFLPDAMIDTSYGADQIQDIHIVYNYINTFTNGLGCPLTDTVISMVEARAVFLDSVSYNPIAVSQENEEILNLIYTVFPYSAQPSQWAAIGNTGFFGNFTFPAGAPIDFLPATAGVGMHAMTYTIENGICSNSFTDSIEVIDAPNPINIPDSMCRNEVFAPFAQQLGGIYNPDENLAVGIQPGITIADTVNTFVVTTASGTGLTYFPGTPERYSYDPSVVPTNMDTLFVEYWYKKVEYDISGGSQVPIDTVEYVIGSITIPIFIDTVSSVEIIDTLVDSVYCEVNELFLLAGSPSGGFFTLEGGSGVYQTGDTLDNNILNPFVVHNPEATNTSYLLTYVKQGAVCRNTDTMTITIPEPLDPTFAPASGSSFYCASDPIDSMLINTTGGFTSDWLINGVTVDTFPDAFNFDPSILNPGNQAVAHVVRDTFFGCVYTEIDTFVVNPLPIPMVNPVLDTSYCTNDLADTVTVSPDPICAFNAPNGLTILSQNFDSTSLATPSFPPSGWAEFNNGSGEPWMLTNNNFSLPFAAMVNQSNDIEDAWLFSPMAPFITGHSYQITMMARANCNNPVGGCDPAQLRLTLANAQNYASHVGPSSTIIVDTNFTSSAYLLYTFTYIHNGVTGNYSLGFNNYTTNNGRSLFLDDIVVDDLSISGCVQGGVGSMTGPGISYLADSSYSFNPQLVSPGSYTITYTYTDAATGCSDNFDMPVKVKPHPAPVFNNLANQYCDNAPVVPLLGVPTGGTFSSTGPNLLTSPSNVYDPNTGVTGEIITYSYTAPNGCSDEFSDTVDVVTIQDSMYISNIDPTGYCANADSIIVEVEPYLGPLAGPGGNPWGQNAGDGYFQPQDGLNPDSAFIGNAIFYQDTAVLESGRHGNFVLTYIYTSSGCVDTTRATVRVHAMPQLSFDMAVPDSVALPDSICNNADQIQVRVNNHIITGTIGQIEYDSLVGIGPVVGGVYTITDTSGAILPGFGLNDVLVPSDYNPGWYGVSYYYTDGNGCSATLVDSFRIDTIPEIYFSGLQPDRIYCENEAPSLILGYPPYYPGSGYMQIVNGTDTTTIDSSFYMIDPAALVDLAIPTGNIFNVYYEFEDLNFCRASGTDSFEVRPYPRLSLTGLPATFCSAPDTLDLQPFVSPQGGIFTDDLITTGIVADTALALNGPAGPRTITYYYVDPVTTCWSDTSKLVTIYNTPDVDFFALGGCTGATITFIADTMVTNLDPAVDSIVSIEWIYGDGNFTTINPPLPTNTSIPDQTYIYSTDGTYLVSLAVNNQNGCTDTVSNYLTISPYVNNYPYVETFDAGNAGWYQEEEVVVPDSVAIWQRAELTGNRINDPGNYAWVTKPQAPYTYEQDERAWVYSPCFDLTNAFRPMIVLDIWRDFLTDIDGSILEYYDYGANRWERLGEKDNGINWYQTNFLVSRPGDQDSVQYPQGWTGKNNGWEKARYRLDHLRGQNFVRFRVAFASDPNTVLEGNEGMAFDSVWVGERTRNVLVEHFSNYYHQSTVNTWNMNQINQNLYNTIFNTTNGRDVSLIQYATPQIATGTQDDPLIADNQVNFADVFARVGYYGIVENSKLRIDGTTRGSGNSEDISQWDLDYDMMQFPAFDITIDQFAFAGNTILVNTTTTAMVNMDSAGYAFYVAITEDDVNNSGNNEEALLRKFRPDAAGEPFDQTWIAGDSRNYSTSWVYPSNVNNGSIPQTKMVCIAFIQNKATREVYQVATTRDLSIFSSTDDVAEVQEDLDGMNLFPNPASSYFNVTFDNSLSEDYQWKLIDVLGRVLDQGEVRAGANEMQVDTRRLSEGNYFFVLENDKVYTQRQVVIVKRP